MFSFVAVLFLGTVSFLYLTVGSWIDAAANHVYFIEIKHAKFVGACGPDWPKILEVGTRNFKNKVNKNTTMPLMP
jgi:hypothetical protein